MMAGDAMRAALETHFGVRLVFQNYHSAAAFRLPTPTRRTTNSLPHARRSSTKNPN